MGLDTVVSETIGFAIDAVGQEKAPPLPLSLYSQARLAARNGVSLTTIVRRYLAGFLALTECLDQETAPSQAPRLRRYLARLLDGLIGEIGDVYSLEVGHGVRSREWRRVKLVEDLLAGNPVDVAELAPGLDFNAWHVALIATGTSAVDTVDRLAKASDRRLLQIRRGERSVWAWLTGRRRLESTKLQLLAAEHMQADGCLALGEPCESLSGWRLSHHQAAAALPVGLRRGDRIVRYGAVPMQASMLQDPVLSESLRQRYLAPLDDERDGGRIARETLRVYFSRDRNISSAATAMGVARQTVSGRLRTIERCLGVDDLHACAHELEAALDLERLERREHAPGL